MPKNEKERKAIHYVVDASTVFSDGYSRSDITKEPRFGKYVEVILIDGPEEVCREYSKMEENEHKKKQRELICIHRKEGTCLSTDCYGCKRYKPAKDGGGTLSLDQYMEESGDTIEDCSHLANPEDELDKKEFWETLERFKDSLSEEERALAEAIINGTPDKELMRKLGITKQSTCNSRKQVVRMKMQIVMKDYRTL